MDGVLGKICAVALLCTMAGFILKHLRGDFSALLRIAGTLLIFTALIPMFYEMVHQIGVLWGESNVEEYAGVMLRALGIALLTRICTDLCRDCGESSLASSVEMAGKLAILFLCIPLIREILGIASKILEYK